MGSLHQDQVRVRRIEKARGTKNPKESREEDGDVEKGPTIFPFPKGDACWILTIFVISEIRGGHEET